MKVIVTDEIREKYPDLRIGILIGNNFTGIQLTEQLILFKEQCFRDFKKNNPLDTFEKHKNIIAWRDIYRSFGVNPKKKVPTAESLLTRVIKSSFIPRINPIVDCYLMAETVHFLPIGGYDLTKVNGDVLLKFSKGNEGFSGIGSSEVEYTSQGEVVYSDNDRILTRRWNYKDCDHSKIQESTDKFALFVEGPINTITDNEIKETISAISKNLLQFFSGTTKQLFLENNTNEIVLL